MKKHLSVAALMALLCTATLANAASGFSRTAPAPASRAPAVKTSPAPQIKPAMATPQVKSTAPAPQARPVMTTPPPTPSKSGFSTGQKLSAAAAATALGSALYAEKANHDAVAAYNESQRQASSVATQKQASGIDARTATDTGRRTTTPPPTATPYSPTPQVIVVQQQPRQTSAEDRYWEERAREERAREERARIDTLRMEQRQRERQVTSVTDTPYIPPTITPQVARQPDRLPQTTAHSGPTNRTSIGALFAWFFLACFFIGILGFIVYLMASPKSKPKANTPKANYTL